jgi:hypothetical protein
MAVCHPVLLPWKAENQPDGLDSGIITSIELSSPRRQHLGSRETVIPAVTKSGLSETLLWRARAGQARRVASMLSARDAALLEAYARECEDCARAASLENARANIRPTADIQRRDDQSPRPLATNRLPNKAA